MEPVAVESRFSTPQWVSRAVDLSAYAGKTIRIRFAFDTGDAAFNNFEGWYVDDVNVFDAAGSPLRAAGGRSTAGAKGESLTALAAAPLLAEALARWQAAGVDTSGLITTAIRIADLPGATLGLASGNTIWLDADAAGRGWFVDPTPADDAEFATPGDQGEQHRIDLLTGLMHEIGHLLGRDHEAGGVMAESLAAGERWAVGGVYLGNPGEFLAPALGPDDGLGDPVTGRRKR